MIWQQAACNTVLRPCEACLSGLGISSCFANAPSSCNKGKPAVSSLVELQQVPPKVCRSPNKPHTTTEGLQGPLWERLALKECTAPACSMSLVLKPAVPGSCLIEQPANLQMVPSQQQARIDQLQQRCPAPQQQRQV